MAQRSARNDATEPSSASAHEPPASGSHRVSARAGQAREQASVQAYLDKYSAALITGDAAALVRLWGVPAFVVGATEARVVQSESEVEQVCARVQELYAARGIVDNLAEILHLDWVSDDLVIAKVRWSHIDERERTVGEEACSYTLLRGEDGGFKARVLTMRGAMPNSLDS
jgi:hypothetical protein